MANISVKSQIVPLSEVEPLREVYFAQLRESQEPLLETLVPQATAYTLSTRVGRIGYALVHAEKGIFEYYVDRTQWAFSTEIFGKFIRERSIKRALIKSYDDLFMAAGLDHQTSVTSIGMLVRDYVPRELPQLPHIKFTCRRAEVEDLPRVQAVDQQVFTHRERLRLAATHGWLWLYEDVNASRLIGFGLIKPLRRDSKDADVGIAVDKPFRNKGFALYMLQDLMNRSVAEGLRPIAGCAMDNLASRRMGQRIGMSPRYRLVSMTLEGRIW